MVPFQNIIASSNTNACEAVTRLIHSAYIMEHFYEVILTRIHGRRPKLKIPMLGLKALFWFPFQQSSYEPYLFYHGLLC